MIHEPDAISKWPTAKITHSGRPHSHRARAAISTEIRDFAKDALSRQVIGQPQSHFPQTPMIRGLRVEVLDWLNNTP